MCAFLKHIFVLARNYNVHKIFPIFPVSLFCSILLFTSIGHSAINIGFEWRKQENIGEQSQFRFVLPRDHPSSGYTHNLWSYAVILSDQQNFLNHVTECSVVDDTVGNHWMTLDGTFSHVSYQIYEISERQRSPWIDINMPHPFPAEYPDSVKLFLQPGRNIESGHPDLIALARSLAGDTNDMGVAARNIATSSYIRNMPYAQSDLNAVLNGTTTHRWADGTCNSALETFQAGEATCAEIARLMTALCRAAGIPARTFTGVSFHVWTEVWIHGFGWQQMEKGFFPDLKPPTLCRLSGNDDLIWFDWSPFDTSTFKKIDIILDQPQTTGFYNSLRLIIALPTTLSLPLIENGDATGLIPIGSYHGLYFLNHNSMVTMYIKDNNQTICLEKSWDKDNGFNDSLHVHISNLSFDAKIKSDSDWIIMEIENYQDYVDVNRRNTHQPGLFQLFSNYPNPFNSQTTISYKLFAGAIVSIKIFDVQGHEIQTLVHARENSGYHNISWNGFDSEGVPVASGVYFYRMKINDHRTENKKMVLLK